MSGAPWGKSGGFSPSFATPSRAGSRSPSASALAAHFGLVNIALPHGHSTRVKYLPPDYAGIAAALGCILGHNFPIWLRFKLAAKAWRRMLGVIIGMMPLVSLIIFAVWAVGLRNVTRYVSARFAGRGAVAADRRARAGCSSARAKSAGRRSTAGETFTSAWPRQAWSSSGTPPNIKRLIAGTGRVALR